MKREQHTIEITGGFELGNEGIDRDPQNPLFRGVERLVGLPVRSVFRSDFFSSNDLEDLPACLIGRFNPIILKGRDPRPWQP